MSTELCPQSKVNPFSWHLNKLYGVWQKEKATPRSYDHIWSANVLFTTPFLSISLFYLQNDSATCRAVGRILQYCATSNRRSHQKQRSLCHFPFLSFSLSPSHFRFSSVCGRHRSFVGVSELNVFPVGSFPAWAIQISRRVALRGTWLTRCRGTVGDGATCRLLPRPLSPPP